jgi:pimeloyl-ACP methyl ester carboxylesterase
LSKSNPIIARASARTNSGTIAYRACGAGPAALFVHGVLLNGYLWRHQLTQLADIRRCIAPDLLGHGDTEILPQQDVSVSANAEMLAQFLDTLEIDAVDLVGNDSGGGIAQIFATRYPQRVRTLTLTNCDTHDNWPPEPFKPFLANAAAGHLKDALMAMRSDKSFYRSVEALGLAYERAEDVSDDTIEGYIEPFLRSEERTKDLERFLSAFDCRYTTEIEAGLRKFAAPSMIVWGTDDIFFDVKWADWLAEAIPGVRRSIRYQGARIFFPEERGEEFSRDLRLHWGQ